MSTQVKYASTVSATGTLVPDFRNKGLLVFFAEGAPEELHEFSVLHRPDVTHGGITVGDRVVIDDIALPVLAVGDVADQNLTRLGHLDLKANGLAEAPLPGDVCVPAGELPVVVAGMTWRVESGEPS